VHVLFESPNSVQLQWSDEMGSSLNGGVYVTALESAWHWYEVSHQDDGINTTVVLAPLK